MSVCVCALLESDKPAVIVASLRRGINFVLSAVVFNVFPTIFEVGLVSGILVSCFDLHNAVVGHYC